MPKKSPATPTNLLFIGNSFTARNKMPDMIARMAEARCQQLEHKLIQAGGASLRMHWNKGEAQEEIKQNRYDYVVLQEQSTLPIKNPVRMYENVRLFNEVIKASGAKTALYLTWARQNAPDTQAAINTAYQTIGEELGSTVVPVGIAWETFLRHHGHPVLHDADLNHPTLAGSYLAACVFYVTIFGDKPPGIPDMRGLTADDAELIHQTAWTIVEK
jgi:hypothetical protein